MHNSSQQDEKCDLCRSRLSMFCDSEALVNFAMFGLQSATSAPVPEDTLHDSLKLGSCHIVEALTAIDSSDLLIEQSLCSSTMLTLGLTESHLSAHADRHTTDETWYRSNATRTSSYTRTLIILLPDATIPVVCWFAP